MKKPGLIFLVALGLSGCRESASPDLRIEEHAKDSLRQVNSQTADTNTEVVKDLGPNAKVVTGVPATTIEQDKNQPDAQPAKDKPGAVAVKMEY